MKAWRSVFFGIAVMTIVGSMPAARGQGTSSSERFVIGSSNTVTADPLVPRPKRHSCVVPLFSDLLFEDFNIKDYQYTPPADCPGPWEEVVFTADFNVTAGRQFDRTAIVDLGFVNIYFGTTPEPRSNLSPSWHVERDITDYSALLKNPQTGHVILGNIVNSTFTGIISASAALEFFSAKDEDARRRPDVVLPLMQPNGSGGFNEPAFLVQPTDQLATTFTLPNNVERAFLDVITQSQIGDEFWYTCVPNDVTAELQSCGNTAFREAEISVDGQPAGVAPVYPWIYTGGIDPFLWEPIPGVQTLNFAPYRVDLTPFAGVLSNGAPHTVGLSVFNADNFFSATATLLLFQDHDADHVTGEVTENTIGANPTPVVNENLQTDSSGAITGTVTVSSSRTFTVAGFVKGSHGRVDTTVRQDVDFNNSQNFVINATTFTQDITQETSVKSVTVRRRNGDVSFATESFDYPLTFDINILVASDGSATQQSTASQEFKMHVFEPFFASFVDNKVNTTDTLNFDSSGNFTGNTEQKSSQVYKFGDSRGQKYDCTLQAESNALTSASEGCTDKIKFKQ